MICIYDKAESDFSTLGIGVLRDFKSLPKTSEQLNGAYNLEFDYIKSGWLSEYLLEGNIVKADGQLFRIRTVNKDNSKNEISVLAKHIWFDLEFNNFLEDVAPTDKVGHLALKWLLDHSKEGNDYTITGDCTKTESARYVRMNPIEAIYNAENALLSRFGGELELNNYNITLHKKRGLDTGIEIRERKNLSAAKYNVDMSSIATRIMPVGGDGLILPEKYIDSPIINNYPTPFYYTFDVDVSVNEDEGITEAVCYEKMRAAVQELYDAGIDKPTVTISVDFVELEKTKEYSQFSNLEKAHLGDTCKVYIPGLNISLTVRIVKIVKDVLNNIITNIELGTPTIDYVNNSNKDINKIKNDVKKVNPASILEKAREDATALINHPFNGYIYISEDTGEMFIMDDDDPEQAENIWKFGLGGIGFSSTGLSGPFTIAITQDGKIVADFITTGHLNTSVIEGYNQLVTQVQTVTSLLDFIKNVTGTGSIVLTDTSLSDGAIGKLVISGLNPMPLYPGMTFPSQYTYPGVLTMYELIFDTSSQLTQNAKHVYLQSPIPLRTLNNVSDELIIENNLAYVKQKIGLDNNNDPYVLQTPIIHEIGAAILPTFPDNTYIYLKYFNNASYNCDYIIQNAFTNHFATKSDTQAIIDITDQINIQVQTINDTKCGKDEVVNRLNISRDEILIQGNRFRLEADNIKIDKYGNIYLNNDSKVIGGDGLLTNLQFKSNGELEFIGFDPFSSEGESNSYHIIPLYVEIPSNFKMVSAIMTLIHSPINFCDAMAEPEQYFWGYARKVKLYKNTGFSGFYKEAVLFGGLYKEQPGNLTEIANAFGANGFTANSASDSSHDTQIVYSADIKSQLTPGINRLILKCDSSEMPNYASTYSNFEPNARACAEKTGSMIAVLNIIGYMSFA